MTNPWSNEHSKDRARERKRESDEGGGDATANERAKQNLRASGEVRETPQAPNDRAYGPKSER
jgi:hypothetical protein